MSEESAIKKEVVKKFNDLTLAMAVASRQLAMELEKAPKNKSANRRARKLSLEIMHIGKEFRAISVKYDKVK
jgi:hypothetical protein